MTPILHLSYQENRVFELLKQGLTQKEIAEKLFISTRTVAGHIYGILNKGNFKNSIHAAAFDGEVAVKRKYRANKCDACQIIKEELLKGTPDREIKTLTGYQSHTYGMLKRLIMNEPGMQVALAKLKEPKPMFKWLSYAKKI